MMNIDRDVADAAPADSPPQINCRAVLFDMDGVLVDSTASVEYHWGRFASHHGLDIAEILATAHGRRSVDTIRDIAPALDALGEAAALDTAQATDPRNVVAIPGALALAQALPPQKWAIVTSAPQRLARAMLAAAGMTVPEVLVSGDDVTDGKPDPTGYQLAATRLGLDAEDCAVIEDSAAGVTAGLFSGATVIAVTTTHTASEVSHADWIVGDLTDISADTASSTITLTLTRRNPDSA